MRDLCIGILDLNTAWKVVLDQLGVWYEEVNFKKDLHSSYSVIIINAVALDKKSHLLKRYLSQGGNLIFSGQDYSYFPEISFKWTYKKRVYNDLSLKGFQHIPYLDLHSRVKMASNEGIKGLIRFKRIMNGNVAYLGFDPAERISATGFVRKPFNSTIGAQPDEIVSKVSKGYVYELFLQVLKEIHFRNELPFVRKWTSPEEKPVFCFRIDSDYSDKSHIDKIYDLLDTFDIKATWFLHVRAHEEWLTHFKTLNNQEIALHGYRHGTSRSEKKVRENISLGLDQLSESGFEVSGFCSPYGIYNEALKKSLHNFDFKYTSEFTYAYDSLPLCSTDNTLQIPIHPICTGSLIRRAYTIDEMYKYFKMVMDQKLSRHLPVIFYHHPLQPGLKVFESIFQNVKKEGLTNLTFEEFANFWEERNKCTFKASYDGANGHLNHVTNQSQLFEISFQHNSSQLLNGNNQAFNFASEQSIQYHYPENKKVTYPEPGLIKKLKLLKTSTFDYRNRERL